VWKMIGTHVGSSMRYADSLTFHSALQIRHLLAQLTVMERNYGVIGIRAAICTTIEEVTVAHERLALDEE
jgi:hypothetical protein